MDDNGADHGHHGHGEDNGHHHGHANDRGFSAVFRYLRHAPRMWRSEINDAVVDQVAPQPGERVLDIGAGMGPGTMRAAAAGADVVAVEPTPFMRRILSVRSRFQRGRQKISVVDGAAEHLPVGDATIDALWAVNTMHHWVDPGQGVAEIARVLRPGGRILLVDEDFDDPGHPDHDRFRDRHADHDHADDHDHGEGDEGFADRHGFTMVDAADMAEALEAKGLVSIEADKRMMIGRPVIAVQARAAG